MKIPFSNIIAIASLVVLASCQKIENIESTEKIGVKLGSVADTKAETQGAVEFRQSIPVYMENGETMFLNELVSDMPDSFIDGCMTKGTIITNENLSSKYSYFRMFGFKGDETYFNYGDVNFNNGEWVLTDHSTSERIDWVRNVPCTFWAYAPCDGSNNPTFTKDGSSITGFDIGTDVSKQKDFLVARAEKTYNGDSQLVNLDFYHVLAAVIFKLNLNENYTIDQVKISDIAVSGNLSVSKESADKPLIVWTPSTTKTSVSQDFTALDFDTEGLQDKEENKVFFMVPQTSDVKFTIKLKDKTSATITKEITVPATTWAAGKLYTYKLSYTGENFVFEVTNNDLTFDNTTSTLSKAFKVKSYKESSSGGDKTAVEYDAEYYQYSDDGGLTWKTSSVASLADSRISGLSATGNAGAVSATDVNLTSDVRLLNPMNSFPWKDFVGSPAEDWDLSKIEAGGRGTPDNAQNTANCYIITRPGTYKFPCVYGNGLINGVASNVGWKSGFGKQSGNLTLNGALVKSGGKNIPAGGALETFLNSKGNAITNSWIIADIKPSRPSAALLWCDGKGKPEGGEAQLSISNVSYADNYISFQTADKNHLVQSNSVIVLYDDANSSGSYDEGEALWSWHIWVTDTDLTPSSGNVGAAVGKTGRNYAFMNQNLGWCDPIITRYYVDDPYVLFKIKLTQQGSNLTQEVIIRQPESREQGVGSYLVYQMGRKDPFIGSRDNGHGDKDYYDASGTAIHFLTSNTQETEGDAFVDSRFPGSTFSSRNSETDANMVIMNSIKYPRTFCLNYDFDGRYLNLWTRDNYKGKNITTDNYYDVAPKKTIYDPSPYGYVAPTADVFMNFTKNTNVKIATIWRGFAINGVKVNNSENIFFPCGGHRSALVQDFNANKVDYPGGFFSGTFNSGIRYWQGGTSRSTNAIDGGAGYNGNMVRITLDISDLLNPKFSSNSNEFNMEGATARSDGRAMRVIVDSDVVNPASFGDSDL